MTKEKTKDGMSPYELKRLENIRQNEAKLASLDVPLPQMLPISKQHKVSFKKPKPSAARRAPAPREPLRSSARLRDKDHADSASSDRKRDDYRLLELAERVIAEKAVRVRPPSAASASRMPFAPEMGATDHFVRVMREAYASLPTPQHPRAVPLPSNKMWIKGGGGVVKVVQERIYSLAVHPSRDKILVAAGSKGGAIGFWDASAFFHDPAPHPPPSPPSSFLFRPHSDSVSTLRYNPGDCRQLFSCGYDGVVQCMDIEKGHFDPVAHRGDGGMPFLSSFDFFDEGGSTLCVVDMSGTAASLDRRESSAETKRFFKLHDRKIGGVSVCQGDRNFFATCSLDNTVCVWDRRKIVRCNWDATDVTSKPIVTLEFNRAVTAVNFHPVLKDCLVTTCYDDHVRIHTEIFAKSGASKINIRHNNQTGRWITTFKAIWDPKSTSDLLKSSVIVGNMNRGVDVICPSTGRQHNFTSEWLTAQPAVNAAHTHLDVIASGNASGKVALWTLRRESDS